MSTAELLPPPGPSELGKMPGGSPSRRRAPSDERVAAPTPRTQSSACVLRRSRRPVGRAQRSPQRVRLAARKLLGRLHTTADAAAPSADPIRRPMSAYRPHSRFTPSLTRPCWARTSTSGQRHPHRRQHLITRGSSPLHPLLVWLRQCASPAPHERPIAILKRFGRSLHLFDRCDRSSADLGLQEVTHDHES